MATKNTPETPAEEMATKNTPETPAEEQLVSIRLPLTKDNQADVFIRVNHRTWLVKRGETVQLPKCAIEVLEHAEQGELESMKYQAAHVKGE